jgi:hypothetical protein
VGKGHLFTITQTQKHRKQLLRAENKQRKTLIPTHCALVLVGKNTQLEQFKWKQNRCISRTSIHRLQVEICAGRTKIH